MRPCGVLLIIMEGNCVWWGSIVLNAEKKALLHASHANCKGNQAIHTAHLQILQLYIHLKFVICTQKSRVNYRKLVTDRRRLPINRRSRGLS